MRQRAFIVALGSAAVWPLRHALLSRWVQQHTSLILDNMNIFPARFSPSVASIGQTASLNFDF